jgi:Spy/CpxP family protein refolding chaperone
MKHILLFLFSFMIYTSSFAQGDGGGKVRNMRIKYINERLQLPSDKNQKFWSVYNQYLDERSELRKIYKDQFVANGNNALDKYKANRFVDESIEYKEKDLELSKKYKNELLKVITSEQLVQLYQIEREFKQHLIETLKSK